MEDRDDSIDKRKSSVALLSVASNTILVLLKLTVGIIIGSVSVISEAIHSSVDLLAAMIALFAVRTSGKPADAEHPFGHGKVENMSGTVEALLIFLAAGWIIFEAVKKLKNPEPLEEVGWGVAVMIVASAANILVSRALFKVGKETDSVALQADAWHLRTDVYTSARRHGRTGHNLDWETCAARNRSELGRSGGSHWSGTADHQSRLPSSRLNLPATCLDVSLPKDEEASHKEKDSSLCANHKRISQALHPQVGISSICGVPYDSRSLNDHR